MATIKDKARKLGDAITWAREVGDIFGLNPWQVVDLAQVAYKHGVTPKREPDHEDTSKDTGEDSERQAS